MNNRILHILFLALFAFSAMAQQDMNEAIALYNDDKYEEAAELFEKVYRKNADKIVYNYLFNCYKETKSFDQAESLISKRIKKTNDPTLWVELGYVQSLQKKAEEAEASFNKALEYIKNNTGLAYQLSEQFSKFGLYQKALECYEIAERYNPNMVFHYQKGLIYAELGDVENMYREYLEMVSQNPSYFNSIKLRMGQNITEDPENEANVILRKQLIKKIQETQNPLFTDLLVWLYVEEMQYAKAFGQLKALDKRQVNQEPQIYSLGEKAIEKSEFPLALDCFTYLIDKGEMGSFYEESIYRKLQTQRLQLINTPEGKKSDYEKLVKQHYSALSALMGNEKFVYVKKDIADLLYFNLNLNDSATNELDRTISRYGNAYKKPVADCKMLLGDILLAQNQPMDAIFKYMEVERAFSGTPLGDQAKFMKGMVAYYQADFPWALNQFEVLKSSTTKLISNDALEMALLITDNSTEDTLFQGLTYYSKADLYAFRNLTDSALYTLEMLLSVFPDHAIKAEATLFEARLLYKKGEFAKSANTLENMLANQFADVWADDALMLLGEIYAKHIGDTEKAMLAYETILFDHPGSTYVPEARRRYRKLRGDEWSN